MEQPEKLVRHYDPAGSPKQTADDGGSFNIDDSYFLAASSRGVPGLPGASLYSGHLGTANYLFSDGHVKALRPSQTYVAGGVNYWYRDQETLPTLSANGVTVLAESAAKYQS